MEQQLHIALIGYGKMGHAIETMALAKKHTVRVIIDNESHWVSRLDQLARCDVAIEFTTPEAAPANIKRCFDMDVPVVTGTTGWVHELPGIARLCEEKKGCLFHASNFSIGVNFFFELNNRLAGMLAGIKGYRPRIVESHHSQKLDAPSGTAITLANDIIAARKDLETWGDAGQGAAPGVLPIKSYRLDDVTGTHVVAYDSDIDSIEIKHTAHNRSGFAEGAFLAAGWVADKQGVFTMKDMLNF